MRYIFVANGRSDKKGINGELQEMLKNSAIANKYEMYVTREAGDATFFVKGHCESHPDDEICYVACGGDGTINEVVSGIAGHNNKSLAIMAMGTGNDFVKYYSDRNFRSVDGIVNGTNRKIDLLRVNGSHYSINVCNIGFEAAVCSIANRLSAKGEKNAYRKGVVKSLLSHRYNKITITADNERLNRRRMLLCTLANNHYVGGEFLCAPRARNDDGLIDLCLVRPISLLRFLVMIPKYAKGLHLDNPYCMRVIKYRQVRHVEIHSENDTELCLDGEMLPGRNFTVDIIPNAINLIVPN